MKLQLESFCSFLRRKEVKTIYLIHEPFRETETREFAKKLEEVGFLTKIGADYRKHGEKAVSEAIGNSDFSVVVAFDECTIRTCERNGVAYFNLHQNNGV